MSGKTQDLSTPHLKCVASVNRTIGIARFDPADISSLVQPIEFDSISDNSLLLMQLNPELMSNLIEGKPLTFVGDENESAVVCSKSSTFDIKEAETSNSLLLLPSLLYPEGEMKSVEVVNAEDIIPQQISGVFHTYLELKTCKPRLQKLRHLLEECTYQGREYETESIKKYTMSDLMSCVQASEDEIKTALSNFQACEIDGYTRLLDFDYKFRVITQILDVIYSESFPYDKVPKMSVIALLEDLEPRVVLENLFNWFSTETNEIDIDGNILHSLKKSEVCKIFAEILLRNAEKFNYREFLDSWRKSVPEGMEAELHYLEGTALIDLTSRPEVIFYFPVHSLSDNVNERFEKLFKTKTKWSEHEILPYIRDMTSNEKEARLLLMKHTRSSTLNGIKMYSSKW